MSRCMIVFLAAVGVYLLGVMIAEARSWFESRKEGKKHG